MPWAPGQSGNKSGGVKRPRAVVPMLQSQAEKLGKMALEQLAALAEQPIDPDPRANAVKIAACKEILDRAGLTPAWASVIASRKLAEANTVEALPQSETTPVLESGLGPVDPLN